MRTVTEKLVDTCANCGERIVFYDFRALGSWWMHQAGDSTTASILWCRDRVAMPERMNVGRDD